MKKIIFIISIITVFVSSNIFSQELNRIKILEGDNNKPIANATAFYDDIAIGISDASGELNLYNLFDSIVVKKEGYQNFKLSINKKLDTIVYLNKDTLSDFDIPTNVDTIKTIKVKEKYNAKKHLKRLREESQNLEFNDDTLIVYYKLEIKNRILNSNKTEKFTAIISVPYIGYDTPLFYSLDYYYADIVNYKNNIPDSTYKHIPVESLNKFFYDFNYLYNRSSWKTIKRYCNLNNIYQDNNRTIFHFFRYKDKNNFDAFIGFTNKEILNSSSFWFLKEGISIPLQKHKIFSQVSSVKYHNGILNYPEQIKINELWKLKNGNMLISSKKIEIISSDYTASFKISYPLRKYRKTSKYLKKITGKDLNHNTE